MKKLLVILFALALVFSFTAPVMATDVSFDGSFRVRGFIDSNSMLQEGSSSTAYYDQRFRLGTVFQVAEGLKVTTRFDAMDGIWGDQRAGTRLRAAAGAFQTNNNIQFDKAYVTFVTGIGQFDAGIMSDLTWGTTFGNAEAFTPRLSFTTKVGDVVLNVHTIKNNEIDGLNNATGYSDRDEDSYRAAAVYATDDITAGLLYVYNRDTNDVIGLNSWLLAAVPALEPQVKMTAHVLSPYFKATFGDLYLEGEAGWLDGTIDVSKCNVAERVRLAGAGVNGDIDVEGFRVYLEAKYNIGSSYVGGLWAFVQGDDPNTQSPENMLDSGNDWDPMLILFNDTCPTALGTAGTTGINMNNGSIYQIFAGTTMDKISIRSSLSIAKADEDTWAGATAATKYLSKDYGTEFDLEASYMIYDNLTYSAGFGYLWAGDYYKGALATNKIDDTYLLMNKLEVVF